MKILSRGLFLTGALIILLSLNGRSQDVHYSQMYSTPLYINPAFTGNHECDYRAGVNYRQQAASFTDPFTTYTAWGDTRLQPNFLSQRGWFGIGAHLYHDNAGLGDLQKNQAMLFAAYSQGFNADNSLYGSLGVGVGYTNWSFNPDRFIFGDNWDATDLEFDPIDFPSSDPTAIQSTSIFYYDLNLGLSLHHLVNADWMYEIGGSLSHINKPLASFYGEADSNNHVGRKFIGHATVQRIMSERFLIKPEVYYIQHEGAEEIIFGANVVYNFLDMHLHAGLWHRLGRDVIPSMGIEYNRFIVLFTYDVNVSKQRQASNYKGGFEISMVKKFCARHSTKRRPCKFLEF